MVDWKSGLKKVGSGMWKGAKIAAKETGKAVKKQSRKNEILNRMSSRQIKRMAKYHGIEPMTFFEERPTTEDYQNAIAMKMSLEKIIENARRMGIKVNDVVEMVEKDKMDDEFDDYKKRGMDDLVQEITTSIRKFKPVRRFKSEFPYQLELVGYLKSRFPSADIERQISSSRPDIVIGGVAIEVKGPTFRKDLDSIASKCMRYPQYFKRGLIVVLFNVQITQRYYDDWKKGLKSMFPEVVVIRI
ncbi:MAG: hypothetical protein ABIN18_22345 [Pseudomonadota bacterium]